LYAKNGGGEDAVEEGSLIREVLSPGVKLKLKKQKKGAWNDHASGGYALWLVDQDRHDIHAKQSLIVCSSEEHLKW